MCVLVICRMNGRIWRKRVLTSAIGASVKNAATTNYMLRKQRQHDQHPRTIQSFRMGYHELFSSRCSRYRFTSSKQATARFDVACVLHTRDASCTIIGSALFHFTDARCATTNRKKNDQTCTVNGLPYAEVCERRLTRGSGRNCCRRCRRKRTIT